MSGVNHKLTSKRPGAAMGSMCVQRGFGLIEVLISVLILAVGILGLAAMQLGAKRASFEATQRSIATSMARDILERMRSNPGELDTYAGLASDLIVDTYTGTPATDCSTVSCTPDLLAAYDMWDWTRMIQGDRTKLAGAAAGGLLSPVVCLHNNAGTTAVEGLVTVVIAWRGVSEIDQTVLDDPGGLGLGECGTGEFDSATVTGDRLRRQLTMTTFVADI
ncbi:MAG: type IV pilus modification protein PilV [Halioglobus sp.]